MGKTIDIFGNIFTERTDGLYKCSKDCRISEEDWGYSEYYGMGLSWILVNGVKVPWVLCPNSELIDTFNKVTNCEPLVCMRSWTLDCDPNNSLGTLF